MREENDLNADKHDDPADTGNNQPADDNGATESNPSTEAPTDGQKSDTSGDD